MPNVRCRYYDDDGRPVREGCRNGGQCNFVHPDEGHNWERAPKPNRTNYRGSYAERANANVADRIASSTWSLPSSPPKRKVDQDRGNNPWENIIDSACGPQESGDNSRTAADRKHSSNNSISIWGDFRKDNEIQSSLNSWGSRRSSWGSDTRGNAPATWDKDVAAAWGVLDNDNDNDSRKSSEKKSGSSEKQPHASTSSWGRIEGEKTRQTTPPPFTTRLERIVSAVPSISTSDLSKPSARSPIETSSTTSLTSRKSYSISPAIPQHAPSSIRIPFSKPSERPDLVSALKVAEKAREASPVFSERSLSPATVDKKRSHYRKAIEKMVTISLLKQQLEKSQQKLLRWKEVQKSRHFARVRVGGAKKLDRTRRFLTKDCQGIQTRIEREEKFLHDIPDLSASTKLDIAGFNEKTAQYLAEVEEWIFDLQKREEKGKAKEREQDDAQPFGEPEINPMQKKWAELKDRTKKLHEKIDSVTAEIEDFHNFDVNEQANAIVHDMLRSKADDVHPQIQEQRQLLLKLKASLQTRQELLKMMQEKHKENLNAKVEIEKTLVKFAELGEMCTARILSLRREIINLHNFKPISYREQLGPQIKDLVDTIINEQVVLAFNALAVQSHKAAEQSHVLAAAKIDEKLAPIEAFVTEIQADAAREAILVRGHH